MSVPPPASILARSANVEPLIAAQGLGLRTSLGWVYRAVDLSVGHGQLALISGPAGSGKTALLLSLAARLRPTNGSLRIGGIDGRRKTAAVRRLVGLALFRGVNDLDDTLTVADQLRVELLLHRLPAHKDAQQAVLTDLELDLDPNAVVRTMGAANRLLLGVALAHIGAPPLIVVDDFDEDLTPTERIQVWRDLRRLAGAGTAIIAGCLDPSLDHLADVALALNHDGSALPTDGSPLPPSGSLSSETIEEANAHALV
ncbi:MAG: ATP-binding cassette domain-containing protein [Thermoleophilia bacterium]